eukprot:CAMPEP_0118888624 /NCGR_PEP_ID=MMETSP1163-20130328/25816_1 /TAXON_ID=124430 /ORGANISM="Phaeomonas parva, Strain CCMP2877" /LENGTH=386 /DNA_ID=CAMNT_0006827195 /DNA_START=133 /DNA_END=1293 /DNA_ORIENTATION=-
MALQPETRGVKAAIDAAAATLGVDLRAAPHLQSVCRDFAFTPLPPFIVERRDPHQQQTLYVNTLTGEETTTHPALEFFAQRVQVAVPPSNVTTEPWLELYDTSGRPLYFDMDRGTMSKTAPLARTALPALVPTNTADSSAPGSPVEFPTEPETSPSAGADPNLKGSPKPRPKHKPNDGDGATVRKKKGGRPAPPAVLRFRTWWNETIDKHRKDMSITFDVATRVFEVEISGEDQTYVLSQVLGRRGPLDAIDLHVGLRVRLLGRHVTIQKTTSETADWIVAEAAYQKKLLRKVQTALLKYDPGALDMEHFDVIGQVSIGRETRQRGHECIREHMDECLSWIQKLESHAPGVSRIFRQRCLGVLDASPVTAAPTLGTSGSFDTPPPL